MSTNNMLSLVKRKQWAEVISKSKSISSSEMLERDTNSFNQTSLHMALTLEPPMEVIKSLLSHADGHIAAQIKEDCHGYLPLHFAIRYRLPFDIISLLIDTYKEGLFEYDRSQWTSIHIACYFNSSPSIIDLLLRTEPSLAKMKTKQNATGLHIACRRKHNPETIKLLSKYYPDAGKEFMNGQWSPLHLAIWHGASEDALMALISAYPDITTKSTSSSGQTPLGLYWSNCMVSRNVISKLLDPSFSTQAQKESHGLIHKVLRFPQKIPNLLTYVLEEFKEDVEDWAKTYDDEGNLPLHVAIELKGEYPEKNAWKKIFRIYPNAILQYQLQTLMYPFMVASTHDDLNLSFDLTAS